MVEVMKIVIHLALTYGCETLPDPACWVLVDGPLDGDG